MTDVEVPDPSDFARTYGPWAVVTGAGQGMGAAFATDLARRGVDVVLVDRQASLVAERAAELQAAGRQAVELVLDLGDPAAPARLLAEVAELDVGLLVANAAATYVGWFADQPLADALRQLDVNCRATLELVHGLLPRLLARGDGGLVLLSSLSAMRGTALTAHYAATKAWNLVLAESLHDELRDSGVTAMAVLPGTTRTPGWESQRAQESLATSTLMEPADVARPALDALGSVPSFVPGQENRDAQAFMAALDRPEAVRMMGDVMRQTFPDRR